MPFIVGCDEGGGDGTMGISRCAGHTTQMKSAPSLPPRHLCHHHYCQNTNGPLVERIVSDDSSDDQRNEPTIYFRRQRTEPVEDPIEEAEAICGTLQRIASWEDERGGEEETRGRRGEEPPMPPQRSSNEAIPSKSRARSRRRQGEAVVVGLAIFLSA
mmetsp:Transcript_29635/g.62946  ORF Transcript_29635/g.62946 Transcript_29635/m.62946 type:complete len:158 (+) Transcript_29635:1037-1510(+)